jgi:photosystem II stability/assembly factor-like uncharacterized protein
MPSLTIDMERQGVAIDQLLIDRGYINSGLVDDVLGRRGKIVCKPWKSHNGNLFPKSAFRLNLRDRTIECPQGQVQRFAFGSVVEFDPDVCVAFFFQCAWQSSSSVVASCADRDPWSGPDRIASGLLWKRSSAFMISRPRRKRFGNGWIMTIRLRAVLIVLAGCLIQPRAAAAQTWTAVGPEGGNVWSVVIDPAAPARIYAVAGGNLFTTSNAGISWTDLTGPYDGSVRAVAIDPVTTSTLYVAASQGMFNSTDVGVSWSPINNGLDGASNFHLLAVNPQVPSTLYVVGSDAAFVDKIFESIDGGGSWNAVSAGLTPTNIQALSIDPLTPTTLYAGTSGGVFKSIDGGGSWSPVNAGLTSTFVNALGIDRLTPTTLYAGTSGGVFKSIDGGGSWSPMNVGLTSTFITAVGIDPFTPTTLYTGSFGGLFKTIDGGSNWTLVIAANPSSLAIDPLTPTTLYAATTDGGSAQAFYTGGIIASVDGGSNWASITTGLNATSVVALAVDPATPTTEYASTAEGTFKSTDGGQSWTNTGLIGLNSPLSTLPVASLAIDPVTPTTVYAVDLSGVVKSTDGGDSWAATGLTSLGISTVLAIDPQTSTTVYAATRFAGVYKTTDGGDTWTTMNNGLPTNPWILSLVIDPMTSILYAGTTLQGVFKSFDGGSNWSAVNNGLPTPELGGSAFGAISALAVDPLSPLTVYAVEVDAGVYRSTDGGANWSLINAEMPDSSFASVLAIDPGTPTTLYVGTALTFSFSTSSSFHGGVYTTSNGGSVWTPLTGEGLTNKAIYALAVTPTTLYAGTAGGGVFLMTRASVLPGLDVSGSLRRPSLPENAGHQRGVVVKSGGSGARSTPRAASTAAK